MSPIGLWLLALCCHAAPARDADMPALAAASFQERAPPQQVEFWRLARPRWATGDIVLQGFFGANIFETMTRTGGITDDVDGSGEEASQMPVIGGGAQWKLGGESIDFGFETMFSFSGRANATAFAFGGGGAVIAVDIDMFLFELYGGPVANLFLGDDARVYASAGPLMEWAEFDQQNEVAGFDDSGSGFGTGFYARTGIEFRLYEGAMIGFGVRWSESSVDLDSGLGTLDLEGFQAVLTVTEGL